MFKIVIGGSEGKGGGGWGILVPKSSILILVLFISQQIILYDPKKYDNSFKIHSSYN